MQLVDICLDPASLNLRMPFGPSGTATPDDLFLITNIDGLEPPQLNLTLGSVLDQFSVWSSQAAAARQLVLTIQLNPKAAAFNGITVNTAADLRAILYSAIVGGHGGTFTGGGSEFFDVPANVPSYFPISLSASDHPDKYVTYGYVSNIAGSLFTQTPSVQLTIQCVTPYFFSDLLSNADNPGTDPTLFNAMSGWTNPGNARSGFEASFIFSGAVGSFTLTNSEPRSSQIAITYGFHAADILYINTIPGSRAITVTRGSSTISLITAAQMGVSSQWMDIGPMINQLTVEPPAQGVATMQFMDYTPQYWGL